MEHPFLMFLDHTTTLVGPPYTQDNVLY